MKKLNLSVVGIFLSLFSVKAQLKDSSYTNKKLKLEEVNLVSSYYHQDGDHAAVTGGIGSQKLTDIANVIDVKLLKPGSGTNLHHLDLELGVDYYSSASSDKIDLKANSSASSADLRVYPSISYNFENKAKAFTVGANLSFSNEFDYQSIGAGLDLSKSFNKNNTELSFKGKVFRDQVKLITPVELRTGWGGEGDDDHYGSSPRNTYSASFSLAQVVNQRLQLMVIADYIRQDGYLGLPFHRVYFNTGQVAQEKLPSVRSKYPVGIRANYFMGDKFIIRSFFRYYHDTWDINSYLADLEFAYKINPFFSVSPFYRYYSQSANKYFKPYMQHAASDAFYTSNYDQSGFTSGFFGAGLRYSNIDGVLGIKHLNTVEIRYGHYARTDKLQSDIISINLKAK